MVEMPPKPKPKVEQDISDVIGAALLKPKMERDLKQAQRKIRAKLKLLTRVSTRK